MLKSTRFNLTYLTLAILGVFMLHEAWTTSKGVSVIPYSEFQQLLRERKVKEVEVSADRIQGELNGFDPRSDILKVHSARITTSPDLALDDIAALTPGFTGADLANLVNEAALAATRRGATEVTRDDFATAIERIVAGLERRNRLLNETERAVVAHHEMGHALVAAALPGTDLVHKVSIIPRGIGALGYTLQRPTDDRYLMTRSELESKMAVLLGGRAAEQVVFGHLSTGAADDLSKATSIARSMVTRYAMVPELGHISYEDERGSLLAGPAYLAPRQHSDETAREIDEAVRRLVQQAFDRAQAILEVNRSLLEEGAQALIAQETLDDAALAPLFARLQASPARTARPRSEAAGASAS
ncbi:MAG: hypothetical protein R3B48_26720 [Kofleriaceae bacterium]